MNLPVNALTVYNALPYSLQNAVCSIYGWREAQSRYGKAFEQWLSWLLESEWWSQSEIEAYQDEKVRELVSYSYSHVPFYRSRMQSLKLQPTDIRGLRDLHKLPVTTKDDVRRHWRKMISEATSGERLLRMHTTGSTGSPLDFMVSRDSVAFRWAIWWRHRHRFGVRPGTWHVNFTGKPVVPASQTRPPFWRINWPMRQVLVSMNQVGHNTVAALASYISSRGIRVLTGYPSIIHAFAQHLEEQGVKAPRLDAVFTGAERLESRQKVDIERVFGCVATTQYGFSEGCGNASQCAAGVYHEDFEYGVLERGDAPDMSPVEGPVLATGFASPVFPFIRYAVGDVGKWAPRAVCSCGRRSAVVLDVEGRIEDVVVTPEGRRIARFDYIFKHVKGIIEAQVVQREHGGITVRIVRKMDYDSSSERQILAAVRDHVSPSMRVAFEYPRWIERGPGGKFRAVHSRVER